MAAEYSNPTVQTVAADGNVVFANGSHACKNGYIRHRDDSGLFTLKGVGSCGRAIYKVQFNGNIAIATGGTVEPISVALTINGEALTNAEAIVTPAAVGDYFNVTVATFIDVPCGCCYTVSVENTSDTTAIDVQNANIMFERVA